MLLSIYYVNVILKINSYAPSETRHSFFNDKEIVKLSKEILLTQAGYDDLVKELDYLKSEKRAEIAEKIKVARGFGDLSENSEYDEAKNEQAIVEARIADLEVMLKNVVILVES